MKWVGCIKQKESWSWQVFGENAEGLCAMGILTTECQGGNKGNLNPHSTSSILKYF